MENQFRLTTYVANFPKSLGGYYSRKARQVRKVPTAIQALCELGELCANNSVGSVFRWRKNTYTNLETALSNPFGTQLSPLKQPPVQFQRPDEQRRPRAQRLLRLNGAGRILNNTLLYRAPKGFGSLLLPAAFSDSAYFRRRLSVTRAR